MRKRKIEDTEHIREIKEHLKFLTDNGNNQTDWETKLIIDECRNKLMILRRDKFGNTV